MQYLMIQNKGVLPIQGLTTLGVSTSRGNDSVIGRFGSGLKMSINVLLRHKLVPSIFLGEDPITFSTSPEIMDDGLTKKEYNSVNLNYKGENRGLGFALEYGEQDWTSVWMAVREFIANALDRTQKEDGLDSIHISDDFCIHIVGRNELKGVPGYTRIFIPYVGDVVKVHCELGKRFLHIQEYDLLKKSFLPKNGRNITENGPMIYCKGVFIREMIYPNGSLFDYNINDLDLDECRNVDEYKVKAAIQRLMRSASTEIIYTILDKIAAREDFWECSLYEIFSSWEKIKDSDKENWITAWKQRFGDGILCNGDAAVVQNLMKKNFDPIIIPEKYKTFYKALVDVGVPMPHNVLNERESIGEQTIPPNSTIEESLSRIMNFYEKFGYKKQRPKLFGFTGVSDCRGYHKDGSIYIHEDHMDGGFFTDRIMMEEVAHYISGFGDCNRDMQEFLFSALTKVANETM